MGPRLGRYRAQVGQADVNPSPEAERQYLDELEATADRLRLLLTEAECGPLALERLHFTAKGYGRQWQAMREQLSGDLIALASVAMTAADSLRGQQAARGRRPMLARDMLLSELVERLRAAPMKADAARSVAAEILERCRVETPLIKAADNTRAMRRAQGRGQKKT